MTAAATPPRAPASRPTRSAAASSAPSRLSAPRTTTAANHSRPRTGSYAAGSKAWKPMPSMPPPSAASAAPVTNAPSFSVRTGTPAAAAPASWSRIAASARPVRPRRSAATSSSAPPSRASSRR
ncbi:hypothetical protein SMD44_01873 [Streptomyces alboflavus]|uniref:Uncharacterized protein n=1 Tax=Streptomyces alboflavus TaxID=67267 RepID=A0A1Z1W7N3_9ACTN|nr:hypothetical protein SMD44_01873 [Streptomyces alboflavus]